MYEMVKDVKAEEYEFSKDSLESTKEYHILSLPPQHISGLTRKERQLKQLMFMALDQLKRAQKQGGDCVLVYGMEPAHVQPNQTNVFRRDLEHALQ
ncbi:hypothetical protein BsIDN1_21110 [Bacillus safensis]|uniref:Uncharacterized protein n=1 Tax=Bacillus safensis TaxID=561879 RepID=A0A5S9M5U5_BACIA|nr:hypothetical protein BsIDN1_21110 [Bacillus safensis]